MVLLKLDQFLFKFAAMSVKQKAGLATKVVRRNAVHLMAFGFIAGRMKCTGVSFTEATGDFLHHFGLQEFNPETLEREMRRMTVEYLKEGI